MKFRFLNKLLATGLALLFWSVSLWADNADPFPEVNPYAYYGNMAMTVKVTKGGQILNDVIVAVYSGDEIRSKGVPTNSLKPGVVYLTVYGKRSGEKLYYRVYNASDGLTYQKEADFTYKFNGIKGTPSSPCELNIDDADLSYGCITVSSKNQTMEVLIDGDKLEDNTLTSAITAGKVTYKRTFTTPYATICLPFAVGAVDAAAAGRFYKFSGINENYEVVMTEETNGLTANTPYIVEPVSMDDEVLFVYNGDMEFPLASTPETTDNGNPSNWAFKGSWNIRNFLDTPKGKAVYFFASSQLGSISPGDFVRVKTSSDKVKAAPFRAYLEYTGNGNLSMRASSRDGGQADELPNSMKVIIVSSEGTPTQIGTLYFDGDDVWFGLDGSRLEGRPAEKGIYINNGRKVIIKGY